METGLGEGLRGGLRDEPRGGLGHGLDPQTDPVERAVGEIVAWLRAGRRSVALLSSDMQACAAVFDRLAAELGEVHAVVRIRGRLEHDQLGAALAGSLALRGDHPERELLDLARRRAHAGGGVVILVDGADALADASAARLRFLTTTSAGSVRVVASADPSRGLSGLVRGMGSGVEFVALHDALSTAPFVASPPPRAAGPLRRSMLPLAAAAMLGALFTLPDYGLSPLVTAPEFEPEAVDLLALARLEEPRSGGRATPSPTQPDLANQPESESSGRTESAGQSELAGEAPLGTPRPSLYDAGTAAGAPAAVPPAATEPSLPAVSSAPPASVAAASRRAMPSAGAGSAPTRVASPLPRRAASAAGSNVAPAPASKLARISASPAAVVPVVVNAHPPATIEVDGIPLGPTPVVRAPVEPGVRRFTALFHDGRRVVRDVDVSGDEVFLVFQ